MKRDAELTVTTAKGTESINVDYLTAEARNLAELLGHKGFSLNTRCGQRGQCNGCEVQLIEGKLSAGREIIYAPSKAQACLCQVPQEDVRLAIPERSLLVHRPEIADQFRINVPFAHDPLEPVADGKDRAIAVDIGTTTVAIALVDLATGEVLARASNFNQQIHDGDDVLTRIQLCLNQKEKISSLQHAVVKKTLGPLIEEVCEQTATDPARLAGMGVAANTTMLHLLAGVDPSPIGTAPFTPVFLGHRILRSKDIGLTGKGWEDFPIHLLPGIAAYIGADLSAGLFTTGMIYDDGPSLLVDVGTNGEIIYKHGERIMACATAAGPAFEGAGLLCGSRGVDGAVSTIRLERDPFRVQTTQIGDGPRRKAIGICGSGYIDLLAEARRCGLLMESGRFDPGVWPEVPAPHAQADEYGKILDLRAKESDNPLPVSEADVARLLQAKAAIAAGILTLLEKDGVEPQEVRRIYLAGGFGMHLNLDNAVTCGLLPDLPVERIEVVGNTSLGGAYLTLLDRNALTEMSAMHGRIEVIELNLEDTFEDHYIDQLSLEMA